MGTSAERLHYDFGDFRFDTVGRALMLRAEAKPLPLTSRAAETLLYLIEHRGEVVAKARLIEAIWPDVVVEENNLNQCISQLRRILGDRPGEPRFIATVQGRGYRFIADINVSDPPLSGVQRGDKSIAVLPFVNLTGSPDKEYFCDGISEELIHTLTRVKGLKVASRTSSFAYKGRNIDAREIARGLGVDALLEGNVSSAGDRIRAHAQLVDGHTGFHIWSQRVDCATQDLFQARDELTVAIVEALRIRDNAPRPDEVNVSPPTRDLVAYDLFLQALFFHNRPDLLSARRAMDLLAQALSRDPDFARANVLSAMKRLHFVYLDVCPAEHLLGCEREIRRALESDPDLAAAHAGLATLLALRSNRVAAEVEFLEAISLDELEPSTRLLHAMEVYGPVGHTALGGLELVECCRLAPTSATGVLNLAIHYLYCDDDVNARRCLDRAVELGAPRSLSPVVDVLAKLAMRAGQHAEAAQYLAGDLTEPLRARGAADVVMQVLLAIGASGRDDQAIAALRELVRATLADVLNNKFRKRCILWFTMLGALDDAFALAHASLDHLTQTGNVPTAWGILWLPEMRPFQEDARFVALAERLGLVDYWNAYGPPDGWRFDGRRLTRA
jgi:TolB-like protein